MLEILVIVKEASRDGLEVEIQTPKYSITESALERRAIDDIQNMIVEYLRYNSESLKLEDKRTEDKLVVEEVQDDSFFDNFRDISED